MTGHDRTGHETLLDEETTPLPPTFEVCIVGRQLSEGGGEGENIS